MSDIRLSSISPAFDIVLAYVYNEMEGKNQLYYISKSGNNLLIPTFEVLRLILTTYRSKPTDFLYEIFNNCDIDLFYQDGKYIMTLDEELLIYIILTANNV